MDTALDSKACAELLLKVEHQLFSNNATQHLCVITLVATTCPGSYILGHQMYTVQVANILNAKDH